MQDVVCPSCRKSVTQQDIAQITQSDVLTVSHASCTECHRNCMIVNSTAKEAQTVLVFSTELTLPELKHALQSRSISSQDVLELYTCIEQKNSTRYF